MHWSRIHILARDAELLEWQHYNHHEQVFNYLIAEIDGQLAGVLGFIPLRQFDPGLASRDTYWVALWKVREDVTLPALGLRLLRHLIDMAGDSSVSVVGIGNPEHKGLYRALGFQVGVLRHYFRRSVATSSTRIGKFPDGYVSPPPEPGRAILVSTSTDELMDADFAPTVRGVEQPQKSPRYFAERFLAHPRYRYDVYRVELGGTPRGLIAIRLASAWEGSNGVDARTIPDAYVLRIVDIWLDPDILAECGPALDQLLNASGAEYLDCQCYGYEEKCLQAAGLTATCSENAISLPGYLEPIVHGSTEILASFRGSPGPFYLFRADGDQDRPNIMADYPELNG